MTLVETIRTMMDTRAKLAADLAALDTDLADARTLFAGAAPPSRMAPSVEAPAPPAPPPPVTSGAVCRGCGKTFTPKPQSAGAYCSRECFTDPNRPTRSRNAAKPSTDTTPPLRAKAVPASRVWPEMRCVNRRCLKKFRPTSDGQIYYADCLSAKGKEPPATSWHDKATAKKDDKFETVWNGGEGLSSMGDRKPPQ